MRPVQIRLWCRSGDAWIEEGGQKPLRPQALLQVGGVAGEGEGQISTGLLLSGIATVCSA
jgi:hypothetical protein